MIKLIVAATVAVSLPQNTQFTDVKGWALIKSTDECSVLLGTNDSTIGISTTRAGLRALLFVIPGKALTTGMTAKYWIIYRRNLTERAHAEAVAGVSVGSNSFGSTIATSLSLTRLSELPQLFSIGYSDGNSFVGAVPLHDTSEALNALSACQKAL